MLVLAVLELMAQVGFLNRMALRQLYIFLGHLHEALVVLMERFDFVFGYVFHIDQTVARAFQRRNDLVELQVNGERIFILAPLNQEDHQKRYDGGACVYYQLPGI